MTKQAFELTLRWKTVNTTLDMGIVHPTDSPINVAVAREALTGNKLMFLNTLQIPLFLIKRTA